MLPDSRAATMTIEIIPDADIFPIEINGNWGYAGKDGKMVFDCRYSFAGKFHNGVAWVNVGGKREDHNDCVGGLWGTIDRSGNYIIEPRYNWLSSFQNGLARVCLGSSVWIYGGADMDSFVRSITL